MAVEPIAGQVALVTGAGQRIGRSIALRLASEGAAVVVHYNRSRREAEEVAKQIQAAGGRAISFQADVSQADAVRKLFAAIEEEFARLDILVNNAGIYFRARFDELSEEQWDRALDTNLKSQYLCAQAAAPLMQRAGRGRIINISSIGAVMAWPDHAAYCVSKAGVVTLTRCLARALAPEITVNSVAPGKIQFPGEPPDESYARQAPLARTGTGEDVAAAVMYFVQAGFVTGQFLLVDGGRALLQWPNH